ncbi:MAG TPA: polysaccharide biosynthesis protein [Candidatus Dependentiae bacterium]|nr:polysaccharide biosynthesis protein [Candidatus Dependentiae bacterium]HRQ63132.1 polysaccharide biosynthesis protein [Candidatus Dependentiae bacterium]
MKYKILSYLLFCLFFHNISQTTQNNLELFENKNILITGGTGYLGRALTTEILKYNPHRIVIFSRDEVKHFNCSKIFNNNPKIQYVIGDIRNYESLLRVTKGIDIVLHAAALKRIDILETNVCECIQTNIIGSQHIFDACVANNVNTVLFVSTDKACLPINTYGACKFISEKIFTNYDQSTIKTRCLVVRYGNVLESTGSVIPIFTEKIKMGQDIPLTDNRMTRFIIDKQEAVELIFDALRYGIGGEIFVKQLPAFKITDLIEILKEKFSADNNVTITGIRPGEKLHEAMVNHTEMLRAYEFKDYFVIIPSTQQIFYNQEPIYMQYGTLFSTKFEQDVYSSDQAVITKEQVKDLFEKLGLL